MSIHALGFSLLNLAHMDHALVIKPIENMPTIKSRDDISAIITNSIRQNGILLKEGDVVCVASKIVSISEDRYIDLSKITTTPEAERLHKIIGKKDPRIIQLMIGQAGQIEENIKINGPWIGVKNHIGRFLTSSGIDKVNENTVLTLPDDPDFSASKIGRKLSANFNANVGVIITDSDGREGITGAIQLCIGLYGVPPIRNQNDSPETACDMLAAAAGLVMGQRGNNIPVVIISGYEYTFSGHTKLKDAY